MSNPSSSSSDKRVALITGANKGIGFEVARQLGQDHGMTVLLGARATRPAGARRPKS